MNQPEALESICDYCEKNNIRCSCGLVTCNDVCPSCRRQLRCSECNNPIDSHKLDCSES